MRLRWFVAVIMFAVMSVPGAIVAQANSGIGQVSAFSREQLWEDVSREFPVQVPPAVVAQPEAPDFVISVIDGALVGGIA